MVTDISPDELWERLQRGNEVQVIDIRSESEYQEGHIPGAENVPFNRFAQGLADREWKDDIVVCCPLGESSQQAVRLLESYEGISDEKTVLNLEGGYSTWEYDLVTDGEA